MAAGEAKREGRVVAIVRVARGGKETARVARRAPSRAFARPPGDSFRVAR